MKWRGTRKSVDEEGPFVPVEDEPGLQAWLDRDGVGLLLLHDPYCPISGHAFREVSRLAGPIALVDVDESPDLSRTIEARTGIRHESPQAILLRDGAPLWSASHFGVTESAIADALARYAGEGAGREIPPS